MKRKFNAIDVLVILIVIALIAGGYLYLNRDNDDTAGVEIFTGKKTVTFIAEAYKVNSDVCKAVNVGDQLVAVGQLQEGYIKEVLVADTADVAAQDGQLIQVNDPTTKRLVVTIEALANKYGPYIDFGGQEIKAGSSYWIKTEDVTAFGIVVKIIDEE